MIGEISALGAAFSIAASAVIAKSLTAKIAALPLSAMRCWFGLFFLIAACFIMGKAAQLTNVPMLIMGIIIGAVFIGIVIGDTLYLKTLSLAEASKVFPVVRGTQILVAMVIAALFFSEQITGAMVIGAILIMSGVYLAVSPKTVAKSNPGVQPVGRVKWLSLAVVVGICWASYWCLMKIALMDVEPLVANTLGLPVAALMLTFLVLGSGQRQSLKVGKYGRATLGLVIAGGLFGYGIGALLLLNAIHVAGVSRTTILMSSSPLFVLGLSAVFLRERLTLRLGLGTLLCVGGIALVVMT